MGKYGIFLNTAAL